MAKTPKVKERKTKAVKAAVTETNLVRLAVKKSANTKIQTFRSGDTVNVFVKVKEGEKERVQTYKGIVTKLQGSGAGRSFTVRKVSAGVGVERTFPFLSSILDKVELVSSGKTRRSKLYYLRNLDGKAAKIESELAVKQSAKEVAAALES
jgi:large subunit ribosomal protein L19